MFGRRQKNPRLAAALARDGRPAYEVARSCRIHPGTVSRLVNCRVRPKPETAEALAQALQCDVDDLFATEGGAR